MTADGALGAKVLTARPWEQLRPHRHEDARRSRALETTNVAICQCVTGHGCCNERVHSSASPPQLQSKMDLPVPIILGLTAIPYRLKNRKGEIILINWERWLCYDALTVEALVDNTKKQA